jgi:hypothetical protein
MAVVVVLVLILLVVDIVGWVVVVLLVVVVLGLVLVEVSVVDVDVVIDVGVVDVKVGFGIEDGVGVAPDESIPVTGARFELRRRFPVPAATVGVEEDEFLSRLPPTIPPITAPITIRVATTVKTIQNVFFCKLLIAERVGFAVANPASEGTAEAPVATCSSKNDISAHIFEYRSPSIG